MSYHRFSKLAALGLSINGAAFGGWFRDVHTDQGELNDTPAPHTLSYFTASACPGRSPNERRADCFKARTKLNSVGSIAGFAVYDLDYYFDNDYDPPDTVNAKSIVIQSGPDEFREIYFQRQVQVGASIRPTEILAVGQEHILWTLYYAGGNYGVFTEDFFSFTSDGNKLMDLHPIVAAAEKQLPPDTIIWGPSERFDFDSATWEAGTEPQDPGIGGKVACCTGRVTVQFKVDRGDFVAVSAAWRAN